MVTAVKIVPQGEHTSEVNLGSDLLHAMYEQIGCTTVETVTLEPGLVMWVDEEGAIAARREPNLTATWLAARFHGSASQWYWGTALITGEDSHGDVTDLTLEALERAIPQAGSKAVAR